MNNQLSFDNMSSNELASKIFAESVNVIKLSAETFIQCIVSLMAKVEKDAAALPGYKKKNVLEIVFQKLMVTNGNDELLQLLWNKKIISELIDTIAFVTKFSTNLGINAKSGGLVTPECLDSATVGCCALGKLIKNLISKS